jgi:hypothetical protein
MPKINEMTSSAKRAVKKAAQELSSREVAIAKERKLIKRHETRLGQIENLLAAARKRLSQLESGEVSPPEYRKPKPDDHVVAPRTGSLSNST